jgi:hypothetical protein
VAIIYYNLFLRPMSVKIYLKRVKDYHLHDVSGSSKTARREEGIILNKLKLTKRTSEG